MADQTQKKTTESKEREPKKIAEAYPEVQERLDVLVRLWHQKKAALELQKDLKQRVNQLLEISDERLEKDKAGVIQEFDALINDVESFIKRIPKETEKKKEKDKREKKKRKKKKQKKRQASKEKGKVQEQKSGEQLKQTALPDGRRLSVGQKVSYTSRRGDVKEYDVIAIGKDVDGVVRFQLKGEDGPSFPVSVDSFMDRGQVLAPETPPSPSESKRERTKAPVSASEIREAPRHAQDALVGRTYQFIDRHGKPRVARIQQKDAQKKRLFVYLPDSKKDVIIAFEDWPDLSKEKKQTQVQNKKEDTKKGPQNKSGEMILHPDRKEKRLPVRSGGDLALTSNVPVEQDTVRVLNDYRRLPPPPKETSEIELSDADIEEVQEPATEPPPIPAEKKQEKKEADPKLVRAVRAIEDAAKSGQAFELGDDVVRIERAVPTPYREDRLDHLTLSTGVTFRDPAEDVLRRLGQAIIEKPITELSDEDIEEVAKSDEETPKSSEQKEAAPRRALDVLLDESHWRETKDGTKESVIAWPVRLVAEQMNVSEEEAFRELMTLSRDGKIKELRFDENTHPILIEVVGAEAGAEQKEPSETYSFSPRELSGILGAETMSRVLGRMTDVFTSDTGSFEQMKTEMDALFDNLSERQEQVLAERLKENGKTVDGFVKEWKGGLSKRVTEGLQYYMLASLERDAYVGEDLGTFEESVEPKAGWKRNIIRGMKSAIPAFLVGAVAGAATGGVGSLAAAGAAFTGALSFRRGMRKDLKQEKVEAQKKFEEKRKDAIKKAQERLSKQLEENGESLFGQYLSTLLRQSGDVDQAEVRTEVLNELRKETEDTGTTMEYLLSALKKRNPITHGSAFSEKAKKMGIWREMFETVKSGRISELWRHDENKYKQLGGDIINAAVAGATGAVIGAAGGNIALRSAARFEFGFGKGVLRTWLRGEKAATEGAYEQEKQFAEQSLAEAESLMETMFEKKAASADDLAALVEQIQTLESLLANKVLLDRAPDLKPRIEAAIEEIKTAGALLNVLNAVRLRTEGVNDRVREMMETRMRAAKEKNASSKWKAVWQGVKEGAIVAGIGGALDLARGAAGGVKDFLEDFFATDRSGVRRIVIPYDEPVRPGAASVPEGGTEAPTSGSGEGKVQQEGDLTSTSKESSAAAAAEPVAVETGPRQIGETHTLQDLDKSSLLGAQKAMWEKYGSGDMLKAVAERHPGWAKFDNQGNITNPDRVFQRWSVEQAKANGQWFDKKAQYFNTRVYKSTEVSFVVDKDGYPTVKLDKYGEFETQKVVARSPRVPEPETASRPPAPGASEEKMSAYDEQLAKDREAHRRIMEDQGGRLTFKDHQELWGEKDTGAAEPTYSAEEIAASEDRARFAEAQRDYFAEEGEQAEAVERSIDARTNEIVNHPETKGYLYTRASHVMLGREESDRALRGFARQYVETHPSFNPTNPKDVETFQKAWKLEAQNAIIEQERLQTVPASTAETAEVESSERVRPARSENVPPSIERATANTPVVVGETAGDQTRLNVWRSDQQKAVDIRVPKEYTPKSSGDTVTMVIDGEPFTGNVEFVTPSDGKEPKPALVYDVGGGKKETIFLTKGEGTQAETPTVSVESPEPTAPLATAERPVQIGTTEKGTIHMSVWDPSAKKAVFLDVPEAYRPAAGERVDEVTLVIEGEPTTGRIELRPTPTGGRRPVLVAKIGGGEEVFDMEKASIRNK